MQRRLKKKKAKKADASKPAVNAGMSGKGAHPNMLKSMMNTGAKAPKATSVTANKHLQLAAAIAAGDRTPPPPGPPPTSMTTLAAAPAPRAPQAHVTLLPRAAAAARANPWVDVPENLCLQNLPEGATEREVKAVFEK